MSTVLQASSLSISFGGIHAVRNVSLGLSQGELLGLIGPNGAGKTTFLRLISGILRPDAGEVRLASRDITGLSLDRRARAGLVVTHQIVRPFRGMSALANVALAAGHDQTRRPLRALLGTDRSAAMVRARDLLQRVGLGAVAEREAGTLPLGQLKRLEVARALALDPKVLLLDEPLAGLNHAEAAALSDMIATLNRNGLTIILVEHRLSEVMRVCSRLAVLDQGALLAEGEPVKVMARPDVRAAYLGGH